jgi:hypothetical protein
MFQKLKHKFDSKPFDILESRIRFGKQINGQFKGVEYFNINHSDSDSLFQLIPNQYRQNFCLTLMKINTIIPPHTDTGILVTINFYLETNNCITQFYKFNGEPKKYQVENQTDGFIYDENDLIKTQSFIAKKNDVYLLDVSQPHSVKPIGEMKERTGLSISTNTYSYDDMCNMLYETGNL